jgi:hypothetical protein
MELAYVGWHAWWWIWLIIYFLPSIIALARASALNFLGVLILNFFFGWTIIGWFLALIWALTANPPHPYLSRWR